MTSLMYEIEGKRIPTWNPFVGCVHQCSYCYARGIAKRFSKRCQQCAQFLPHFHPERLKQKFKNGMVYFVCSMGDICFAQEEEFYAILQVIRKHPETTFYLQSKNPTKSFLNESMEDRCEYPNNLVLGTTIECDKAHPEMTKAPSPYLRFIGLNTVKHNRKYAAIEPIMDFDFATMLIWINELKLEFVYIGDENHNHHLPEPSLEKTKRLILGLSEITEVRVKTLRKAWWE